MRAHATYSPSFFLVPGIGGEGVHAVRFYFSFGFLVSNAISVAGSEWCQAGTKVGPDQLESLI